MIKASGVYSSLTIDLPNGKKLMIRVENSSLIDVAKNNGLDCIVNAANCAMRGGGGIDGVIHSKVGESLLKELEIAAPNGCETGEVIVTSGGDFVPHILHTPGPVYKGGTTGEADLLSHCYWNCMNEANKLHCWDIGFCSISTGIYGYPLQEAADIAMKTVLDYADSAINDIDSFHIKEIYFAMFKEVEYEAFCHSLRNIAEDWAEKQEALKPEPLPVEKPKSIWSRLLDWWGVK